MRFLKTKKALEFQYVVAIIIILLLFLFVILWYAGLGDTLSNLVDAFFK